MKIWPNIWYNDQHVYGYGAWSCWFTTNMPFFATCLLNRTKQSSHPEYHYSEVTPYFINKIKALSESSLTGTCSLINDRTIVQYDRISVSNEAFNSHNFSNKNSIFFLATFVGIGSFGGRYFS
ncbi:hypothetical protein BLOT_002490, partial [Blomia tropicalis]